MKRMNKMYGIYLMTEGNEKELLAYFKAKCKKYDNKEVYLPSDRQTEVERIYNKLLNYTKTEEEKKRLFNIYNIMVTECQNEIY